ncbi:hypothetical protein Clacol_001078 [Clathrus columnatus]|uniref:Jacalin-type lectin domain-containing protein n=1 Tax=Clathrus columnatus TaxID=1419009 RepID=A0AAV5A0E6_9AGAM|nr:hypothetical protein Clacol_001078 [Clathrus columnatus]
MSTPVFLPTSQKGGNGGTKYDDLATYPQITNYRLAKINYWTNSSIIRGIQFEWEGPRGEIFTGDVHGGSADTFRSFTLNPGERIVVITGRAGSRVDALTFITNQGKHDSSGSDLDACEAIFVVLENLE